MAKMILFATYWNEIEWIEASLAQIEKIDPDEIIICDGCFDPRLPNYSTDGTREKIESFACRKNNVAVISAIRLPLSGHFRMWFKGLPHEPFLPTIIPKLRSARHFPRFHVYRLNQCTTFNQMIALSKNFSGDTWFMTYDCDQFYSDGMLAVFQNPDRFPAADMLACREKTFFHDFHRYTDRYEKRDYNNMPHRVFPTTRFIPTRHPVCVVSNRYRMYTDVVKKMFVGDVYHYHIKSMYRIQQGYALGDRKPPKAHRTRTVPYTGTHPAIIENLFRDRLRKTNSVLTH